MKPQGFHINWNCIGLVTG